MNQLDPSGQDVVKEYSRDNGDEKKRLESARITFTLVVDTKDCPKVTEKEKCTGDVKLTLKYKAVVKTSDAEKLPQKIQTGGNYGFFYAVPGAAEPTFNPFVSKDGKSLEGEIGLGTIPCKGGDKSGGDPQEKNPPVWVQTRPVGNPPKGKRQQRITFKVIISCCGHIDSEELAAVNDNGIGMPPVSDEGKPLSRLKDLLTEDPYPSPGGQK